MNLTSCNIYKKTIFLIIAACLLITLSKHAAAEPLNYPTILDFSDGEFEVSGDGLNIFSFYENGMLNILLDAHGLTDKEYYTAHFYKTGVFDLADFAEVAFRAENPSDNELKMNFVLTDYRQNEYVLTENTPILVLRDGDTIKEFIPSEWGSAEIPPNFKGNIHISEHLENTAQIGGENHVSSFGLSFTIQAGASRSFFISNVMSVPAKSQTPLYNARIIGEELVQMPVLGETIVDFKALFDDKHSDGGVYENVKFGMAEEFKGISISEDGRLTVSKDLREYYFQIYAEINDIVRVYKNISVYDHWSVEKVANENVLLHLPSESEVSSLKAVREIDRLFFDERMLRFARLFLAGVFVLVCGFYAYITKRRAD